MICLWGIHCNKVIHQ